MFSRLYLEITTCCNRACSFCPGTARPAAFLSPADFRTLAAKLRPYGQYLYLHVMGEPLLHLNAYFHDQYDHPLCIGRQYYIGSRYMFEF